VCQLHLNPISQKWL
jgi:hypothetical protein